MASSGPLANMSSRLISFWLGSNGLTTQAGLPAAITLAGSSQVTERLMIMPVGNTGVVWE